MLALSIRQPYAELILRGEKTIEYRSQRTRLIGRRFAIYVPKKWAAGLGPAKEGMRHLAEGKALGTRDLALGGEGKAPGTRDLASGEEADASADRLLVPGAQSLVPSSQSLVPSAQSLVPASLPTSLLVGSAVISHCSPPCEDDGGPFAGHWRWHLVDVRRWKRPRKVPAGVQPQPVWFRAA